MHNDVLCRAAKIALVGERGEKVSDDLIQTFVDQFNKQYPLIRVDHLEPREVASLMRDVWGDHE